MRGRAEPIRGFDSRLWLFDGDAHLGLASNASEQYHAEGLYKDRSAFYTTVVQWQYGIEAREGARWV